MSCLSSDITRKIGDTYPIELTVKSETGAPFDLTGAVDVKLGISVTSTVESPAAPDLLLSGAIGADPASGKVSFSLTQAQADALAVGDYFAEVQFTQSSFVITTETFRYFVKGQIVT